MSYFRDRAGHGIERRDGGHDFADAAGELALEGTAGRRAVHRAQRFGTASGAVGNQGVAARLAGALEERGEKVRGDPGHVAGGDQVPLGWAVGERGEDSAQGAFTGIEVRNRAIAREINAADDHDAAGSLLDSTGDGARQRAAVERQQRFVPAHPGAAASGQQVARLTHREMIPLEFTFTWKHGCASVSNILMRFCSTMWIGSLLATGVLAGAEPSGRVTSVVRSDPRTGRLVRSVVVTPRTVTQRTVPEAVIAPREVDATAPAPAVTPEPTGLDQAVALIAAQHALPPDLLHSVIKVESNYNPWAVSPKGALGMMQLIPATARRFGVGNVFNPVENIQGGAKYLRYLLDLYNGNPALALAAYNAGEGAVAKYRGVPPYRETQNYLHLVKRQLDKKLAAKPAPPAAPKQETAKVDPDAPAKIREIVETNGTVRYVSR